MSLHCGGSSSENTTRSGWVLFRAFFSLFLPIFYTLAHNLACVTMRHRFPSSFSVRAESWPRISKRCFASMTTLGLQSQASPRMHACLGSSHPISFSVNWLENSDMNVSLCMRACSNFMRQQAMASKMVFNRPVPVNRLVSTIADSASFPPLSLRTSSRVERERFISRQLTRTSHSRGPGKHAGIRPAPIRCWLPRRRPGPHRPTFIRVLAKWHLIRVLCRFDRRAQPKRQDISREAL